MPAFDGTGPQGQGPKTGRGFGQCGIGLGWRRQCGMGRGMGRYFNWNWPQDKEGQNKALEDYKKALEEEMEDVNKKLENIKNA